jgi:NADPH:quinone reductase-like Zn-dependent oxidoreductase
MGKSGLVSMGKSGGPIPPLDLDQLNRLGSLCVTRPNAMHCTEPRRSRMDRGRQFEAIARGDMGVLIERTFALEHAAEAHDIRASRESVGKFLLLP